MRHKPQYRLSRIIVDIDDGHPIPGSAATVQQVDPTDHGSAALTALALFAAFRATTGITTLDITDPNVMAGLFIGGLMPFLFTLPGVATATWKTDGRSGRV